MRASAPAKAMLFGEYAVLEGYPAVALCLDRRIRCEVIWGGDRVRVVSPGVFEPEVEFALGLLEEADCPDPRIELLWPLLKKHVSGGVVLRFESEFPTLWGLGSSSASTLAAAAALAGPGPERWQEVQHAQRRLQGAASGYDAATQYCGGLVAFRMGDPGTVERLAVPGPEWMVGWTGSKVSTGEMIRSVRREHPPGASIYRRIGALSEQACTLLPAGDTYAIGGALNEGQALLAELGAVPGGLTERLRSVQADPAVHGARLSGAGGGDCLVLLVDDRVLGAQALRQSGFEPLDLYPEAEGLRMEDAA